MKTNYPNLFTPFKIGKVEIKNRFHLASMGGMVKFRSCGNELTPETIDHFVNIARGGTGIVATPPFEIYHAGENYLPGEKYITEKDVDVPTFIKSLSIMADKIHTYGSKLMCQLSLGTFELLIPVVFSPRIGVNDIPTETIKEYAEAYRKAAVWFKEAGVDIIEVHSIHTGYIIDQFCTPSVNTRTDEYGGCLGNRCRLAVEILQAIKDACGEDYPVTIKIGAKSEIYGLDLTEEDPAKQIKVFHRNVEESFEIAEYLAKAGYDAIDCDGIGLYTNESCYFPKGMDVELYKKLHDAIDVPLIVAGRLNDPKLASHLLSKDILDCISIGRQFLADPNYVNKIKANCEDDIRYCLSCNEACFKHVITGLPVSCAVNPQAGAPDKMDITPALVKRNILIVGGGLAGMDAARVATLKGHHVELYEKGEELGGVFIAAAAFDFKEDDKNLIRWYRKQMKDLNINVHLNTEVTREMIDELSPEVLIVATGADPIFPPIEGINHATVITATEFLLGDQTKKENIVIIGGGLTGCEIAFEQAEKGKNVSLVEMLDNVLTAPGIPSITVESLKKVMDDTGVNIYTGAKVEKIDDDGVTVGFGDTKKVIKADSVVTAVGYKGNTKLYDSLADYPGQVYLLGDAKKVSNVKNAIWNGFELANNLK